MRLYPPAQMPSDPPDLLIVYNADGGPFAMLADALHKVVSPGTYPCSLCAVTYGPVAMRGQWRAFLDRLPNRKRFYHRDDFAADFPGVEMILPAILTHQAGQAPEVLVSAAELDSTPDLANLIELVGSRLL